MRVPLDAKRLRPSDEGSRPVAPNLFQTERNRGESVLYEIARSLRCHEVSESARPRAEFAASSRMLANPTAWVAERSGFELSVPLEPSMDQDSARLMAQ